MPSRLQAPISSPARVWMANALGRGVPSAALPPCPRAGQRLGPRQREVPGDLGVPDQRVDAREIRFFHGAQQHDRPLERRSNPTEVVLRRPPGARIARRGVGRSPAQPTGGYSSNTMLHPLFTEEHEQLRRSVRQFVESELAPHAQEWEREGGFPDWVFKRMGDLGFMGVRFPEEYGGQGGDWGHSIVTRRGDGPVRLRRGGDGDRRAERDGDAADLQVRHRGPEAALPGPRDQGRRRSCA